MTARKVARHCCSFCGAETDKYRYCMNCGKRMCWKCVGRLGIAVHFSDGRRETSVYICPSCMSRERINVRKLLEKLYKRCRYPSIKKMIDRVKALDEKSK